MVDVPRESEWTPPARSGWVWDAQHNSYLWWDGRQYTLLAVWVGTSWRIRPLPPPVVLSFGPRATRRARRLAVSTILAGGAVLVWMAMAVDETECQVGPDPTRTSSYPDPGSYWLPWFAFAGVAGLLIGVWRSLALDVSWVKGWSLAAVIVAVIIFPLGPLFMLAVMNCAM